MIKKLKEIMAKKGKDNGETQLKDAPDKKSKKDKKELKIKQELEELKIELTEQKDKFLRLFAEFDNFKKRTVKERLDLLKTASSDTIQALLPILDDFERAKKASEEENAEETFSDGIKLVYTKLNAVLKSKGLEEMVSTGEVFDPELHQALTEIPASNDDMKGKIIDTVEKGYLLKDKIIRHAKVVIGK